MKIFLDSPFQVSQGFVSDKLKENMLNNFFIKHVNSEPIPVEQTAFYDLGFDPDFSIDGNVFYKQQASFALFYSILKMVRNVVKYFLKILQGKIFQDIPEKKAFQELMKIEKIWQKTAQAKGMLYPVDTDNLNKVFWQVKAPYICSLKEHQFFHQLSKLASIKESTKQVYASELLKPLHNFNRPQVPSSQSKKHILEQKDREVRNVDVARMGLWGFILLGNQGKGISHKDFLESIDIAGNRLKQTIRDLRFVLRRGDAKAFNEKLHIFKLDWNAYVKSHPLLKELAVVYSQKNFFEETYQDMEKFYQEMQGSSFFGEEVLETMNNRFIKIGNLQNEDSRKLQEAFLATFPSSKTAERIKELAF